MIIDSKYSKQFISNSLTETKYNELHELAVTINNLKNKVSKEVNDNLLFFLDMKPLNFVTYMRNQYPGIISSNFDKQLYRSVIDCYQNKFDAIQKALTFEQINYLGIELYKRDTKKNKRGDFKKLIQKKEQTSLTSCLTYLARYGSENTLNYITEQLKTITDTEKIKYYQNILTYVSKFGFNRLLNLALSKRIRIIKKYSENPINFKSLTFGGRSRLGKILDYNKNYNSVINSFISLSWTNRKRMDIPVKFSKDYHGNVKNFLKKTNDYEYVITFNERKKQITVNICKDGERYIPDNKTNYVGIDVNIKHNLFSLSNGDNFDYNIKLVNDYSKLSSKIDSLKKDKEYSIGKRKQWKLDKLSLKMKKSNEQLISNMCKRLQSQGIDHIVMENLDNGFGKSYVKDGSNEDINFNRVVKFLSLSSLKQMVEHIGRNYDIALSTVHSSYTSKMCPVCGCIEDENRPSQEEFSCINCGHEDNADHNAAVNIENRVSEAVLRNKLLKQLDNGAFEPKKLKREKVKEVLLSYRTNLVRDREPNFS